MKLEFFPSPTTAIYMARMFLIRILAVLAIFVIVLQTLDLLGESGKILAVAGNSEADLWQYISLRAPQIIEFILPFSVLLATIITLASLNQNSEVIAMKAAGLSAHQVLAPLLFASLLVAGITFAFNDRIVAPATSTLSLWQKAEYGPVPDDPSTRTNIWARDGNNLVHAGFVSGNGNSTRLDNVEIYERAGDGALVQTISAAQAVYSGNGWKLKDAVAFDVTSSEETKLGDYTVNSGMTPDQFTLGNVNADGLSFMKLKSAIDELKAAGKPTQSLETNLWHKISGPLSAILMPLLGAVAAFGLARSGQLFLRAVIGMALGFAFFVADNFSLAMGNLGAYPPLVAAWAPFVLFFLVGESVLIRTEE